MTPIRHLAETAREQDGLSRRQWLTYTAALSSVPLLGRAAGAAENPKFSDNPFALGVASGDPDHRGFVIWTRLAPRPTEPGGGMPQSNVPVGWQVAEDDAMRKVVASGTTLTTPSLAHSVHVELDGLKPDRWYWYRFWTGDEESPVGRTRTLPAPNAMPKSVRFAVTSCQNFEQGLFTAYQQMAADDPDLVFHLGDYIYEYEAGRGGKVRTHIGKEIRSLDDYRVRLSQYRADPLLHGMHAKCPWFVTWDDHEVDNNYANDISEEKDVDPADLLIRRANAYQAYYEMMPLRRRSLPNGPDLQLYRRAPYGRLADLMVLDTRQYRSDQPNDDRKSPLNDAALDRSSTMLGRKQHAWLCSKLISSQATWNVLAQQVMMGMVGFPTDDEPVLSMDQWPGYAAERMALVRFMAERNVSNPVVLTGDIHSNWANELRIDDRDDSQDPVATEFVTTSLSSGGNGVDRPNGLDELMAANPCIRFHNRERGYIRCTVTPDQWRSDYVVVEDVLQPGGKILDRASFVVEAGSPKVHPA